MKSSPFSATALVAAASLFALAAAPAVRAQQLTIGSPNVAVADPVVPLPPTKSCVVTLYTNESFPTVTPTSTLPLWDGSNHPFTYTPPAACPGPWEKVVYSADFSVNAGVAYDRTAIVWLGGAVIFLGTTEEPNQLQTASWHINRDITDYSSLLTQAQSGYINLSNWYDPNGALGVGPLTGIYHASAQLLFYPAPGNPQGNRNGPRNGGQAGLIPRPDQVLNLEANSLDELSTPSQQLAATLTLPTNIERAFLDVYAQNQSGEEFFFFDVADQNVASAFEDTYASPYKEAEVTIDGQPAGIAPAYPWIFTGGGDPILWQPIPGVQTLDLQPYRVDLTPFVGLLDNGKPHTIAVNVNGLDATNSTGYFQTAASLLLYLDHGGSRVTGQVTEDTLQATPVVNTDDQVTTTSDGSISGPLSVTSSREFTITGTANTSHGTVTTSIHESMSFSNVQQFTLVASTGANTQDAVQDTKVDKTTTITTGRGPAVVLHEFRDYPLTFNYDVPVYPNGSFALDTFANQEFEQQVDIGDGWNMMTAQLDNHRLATATRNPYPTPAAPTNSSQSYTYSAPFGACYSRTITSALGTSWPSDLTSVTDGVGCPGRVNALSWNDEFSDLASREFGATVQLLP